MRPDFFAQKEQSEFIQRVYRETPPLINDLFHHELNLLKQSTSGNKNILEVGCGFGRALESIDVNARYFGVDIGFAYLAEARKRNQRGIWFCADATKLPFPEESFHCVFCIQNTLGNMEGIEQKVIAECKRVCQTGGSLIFSVYSEDSFDTRRLWYDRLVDAGIFGRIWLDPSNPRIVRSDTGWSSRCFGREELKGLIGLRNTRITKLDSFLYFLVAQMQR